MSQRDDHHQPHHADEYAKKIQAQLPKVIQTTDLKVGTRKEGKVRDCYILPNEVVIVTTDRVSAFDRVLASVPFKGQVLNLISLWWFEKTKHIVANHVIRSPNPNTTVGKKCTVFPIEFVVRGYLTGSTDTSILTHYTRGERVYCGIALPNGLQKNQKLEKPLVTPTTKAEQGHDELISAEEIVEKKLMSAEEWQFCSSKALELFSFGQKIAKEHNLLLVDTKYEFGKDAEGNILLVDEIHTPDSSRYWIASSYDECFSSGKPPQSIDKDILRSWYREHCDPYKDKKLPKAPEHLVVLLSRRYIELYELITGQRFPFAENNLAL